MLIKCIILLIKKKFSVCVFFGLEEICINFLWFKILLIKEDFFIFEWFVNVIFGKLLFGYCFGLIVLIIIFVFVIFIVLFLLMCVLIFYLNEM